MKKPRTFAAIGAKLRKNRINKLGEHSICIRIFKNRKESIITTEYSSVKSHWDKRTNSPNSRHPEYQKISEELASRIRSIRESMSEITLHNPSCSSAEIKDYHLKKLSEPAPVHNNTVSVKEYATVQEIYDKLTGDMFASGQHSTAYTYKSAFTWMKRKKPLTEIRINEVTCAFLEDLKIFIIQEKEKEIAEAGKGYFEQNTLFGYFKNYLALVNYAVSKKYIKPYDTDCKDFKLRANFKPKPRPRPISREAIRKIMSLELKPYTRIWNSRNYFLFSIFANGINFTDMALLTEKNLYENHLHWERNKTRVDCDATLNPQTAEIINYYEGHSYNDYIFPIIKKQYDSKGLYFRIKSCLRDVNVDLKTLAKMAGISANVTFYTGRHSTVSTLQDLNVPDNEIATFIGQEDGKALRAYLKSLAKQKSEKISENLYRMLTQTNASQEL